jgi:hypothetical protein
MALRPIRQAAEPSGAAALQSAGRHRQLQARPLAVYRKGTTTVYSYIESRGGRYPSVMLAAFQRLLYERLGQPITRAHGRGDGGLLPQARLQVQPEGWEIILNEYGGRCRC